MTLFKKKILYFGWFEPQFYKQLVYKVLSFTLRTEKNRLQKLLRNPNFSSLLPWVAQRTQTEELINDQSKMWLKDQLI